MDEAVRKANESLTQAGCRVKLAQRVAGGSLSLVATLPPKPGSQNEKPHQQKISLKNITGFNIPPHREGLKRAVAEAKRLDSALMLNHFQWESYLFQEVTTVAPLAGPIIARFERWYFDRNGQSNNTRSTWETDYWEVYKRLEPGSPLTQEVIEDLIRRTEPNTRTRKRYCMALKRLAEFGELPVNIKRIQELKGNYGAQSVEPRELLSDERIERIWEQIEEPWLKLWWGYLATYGLRNHELYYLDNQDVLNGGHTVTIKRYTKTKRQRIAYPLPRRWVDQFDLRKSIDLEPTPGVLNKRLGEKISKTFQSRNLPTPYTLRHCWRERAIRQSINPSVAARSLGHSVAISQQHYTTWISEQTCEETFQRAEEMGRNAGSTPHS